MVGVQADFTPYEGKSVAAAVIDPDSAAVQDHDMDLAIALQMQEVRLPMASCISKIKLIQFGADVRYSSMCYRHRKLTERRAVELAVFTLP